MTGSRHRTMLLVDLGRAFEQRPNALNAVRLVLAATVIAWHGFLFRGAIGTLPLPLNRLFGEGAVDAFFVISGFLIVRSWERNPQLGEFARARAARLLPGLWACLVVTAFVIAPLAAGGLRLRDQLHYVWGNAFLYVTQANITGSPELRMHEWNSSLWTLFWEGSCYLAVALLGVSGRLRVRPVAGFALFLWGVMALWWVTGQWAVLSNTTETALPRLGLDFALGALLWLLRDRVPFSGRIAAAAAVLLTISLFTECYHVLGAAPLAYLSMWVGVEAGRNRWLRWRHDLSYGAYIYGGPLMQSLVLLGAAGLAWWEFTLLSWVVVAPVAAASWFLVERPVLRWVRQERRTSGQRVAAAVPVRV